MSNIQKYHSAFEINFPVEIADQLLARMQSLYGDAFDRKYGEIEPAQLQITACTILNGLSEHDLRRGLERMNTEKWCPSLPEFRSWCVHDGDWWTAEMAWAKALNFVKDETQQITTMAKRTLDEVKQILSVEGQRAAHKAFIEIYTDYLIRAKKQNRTQIMWIPPKSLQTPEDKPRTGIPCPPELAAKIKGLGRVGGGL
ncbi:restriction endonuclease [Acinetobacter sp. YH01020]|uniref:restriction endonuclease n=1 Tax=Acinetobacter sp. YH01020 TaxID=2601034 RepID=UPI0015D409A9|nr:restriction endonuclease [Acinetobacter sp. YH01020]